VRGGGGGGEGRGGQSVLAYAEEKEKGETERGVPSEGVTVHERETNAQAGCRACKCEDRQ